METKDSILITEQNFLETYTTKKFGYYTILKYKHWFPVKASVKLAQIVASILTDGYLEVRTLKNGRKKYDYFGFYSKDILELKKFNLNIYNIFKVNGIIKEVGKRDYGFSMGCLVLNAPPTRVMTLCGVPANDKVSNDFQFPKWILESDKNIKSAFLRKAFSCDGCIGYDKSKNSWEIRFFSHKIESLFKNGLE